MAGGTKVPRLGSSLTMECAVTSWADEDQTDLQHRSTTTTGTQHGTRGELATTLQHEAFTILRPKTSSLFLWLPL